MGRSSPSRVGEKPLELYMPRPPATRTCPHARIHVCLCLACVHADILVVRVANAHWPSRHFKGARPASFLAPALSREPSHRA